ncbi:EamA family transporter [Vibrio sp. Isolate25]|uniref:EamA family transporter n=1 Tax=Vibrio sp. Isolate25 TaxID=2908535 RepID=UPI001EFC7763|nr:EamA family transporter [Vibrio sp. Isolate25]MCG9595855.1 EamA family transporter [Vibrio sp. Isolate25]
MSLWAITLVVISAFLHAGWNLLSKSNKASGPAFFLASSSAAAILLTPYVIWYLNQVDMTFFPTTFWLILIVSGIAQMIYLLGLGFAYKQADIGVIYPIARALPVLMVGLVTVVLGYELSINSWIGFTLITLGCLFVPLESFSQFNIRDYLNVGVLWALIAAFGTTGYSILDKEALLLLASTFQNVVSDRSSAIFYLGIQFWSIALCIALYLLIARRGDDFKQAWAIKKPSALAGTMMSTTYGLVLYAMTMTENVSYVVALRQLSIVFGMVFGIIWLSEKFLMTRLIGTTLILVGLVLTVA